MSMESTIDHCDPYSPLALENMQIKQKARKLINEQLNNQHLELYVLVPYTF